MAQVWFPQSTLWPHWHTHVHAAETLTHKIQIKILFPGAGEMAQWLQTHTALVEDLSSVSSIHVGSSQRPVSSMPMIQCLWPLWASALTCTNSHIDTYTQIKLSSHTILLRYQADNKN